jgi:hypothetical protein
MMMLDGLPGCCEMSPPMLSLGNLSVGNGRKQELGEESWLQPWKLKEQVLGG